MEQLDKAPKLSERISAKREIEEFFDNICDFVGIMADERVIVLNKSSKYCFVIYWQQQIYHGETVSFVDFKNQNHDYPIVLFSLKSVPDSWYAVIHHREEDDVDFEMAKQVISDNCYTVSDILLKKLGLDSEDEYSGLLDHFIDVVIEEMGDDDDYSSTLFGHITDINVKMQVKLRVLTYLNQLLKLNVSFAMQEQLKKELKESQESLKNCKKAVYVAMVFFAIQIA